MSDFILDCVSCGVINPEEARFCKKCGTPLKEKTFLFHLKRYAKLISVISVAMVLIGVSVWFYSKVHEPTTTQLTNNVRQSTPKQPIIKENSIDKYWESLIQDLANKHPATYKSIANGCIDLASTYDNTKVIHRPNGVKLTEHDGYLFMCIVEYIESPITAKKEKSVKPLRYSLSINPSPKSARIRILNIKPKYHNGIQLRKGKYHIEVSAKGYETLKKWVNLTSNNSFSFSLKKRSVSVKSNVTTNLQSQIVASSPDMPMHPVEDVRHTPSIKTKSQKPNMAHLTGFQISSIEKTCKYDKDYNGPADYYQCIRKELGKLSRLSKKPNMAHLTGFQISSIEKTCKYDKDYNGPADYYQCILKELRKLSKL